MTFDWRAELRSDRLYYEMLVAESFEQFVRKLGAAVPVLLLLRMACERREVGAQVIAFAEELLAEPVTPGELSDAEVPLAASAYVLSHLDNTKARATVEEIAGRNDAELRWAPRTARRFLARFHSITAPTRTRPVVPVGALSLLNSVRPARIGRPHDTVHDASRAHVERIAA